MKINSAEKLSNKLVKAFLKNKGILIGGRPPTFRLVIHRDINEKDIPTTVAAFAEYFRQ